MACANSAILVTENSKIIQVFSTETGRKSSMGRKLSHSSFLRYPVGGAVFRAACTSARLIHCIAKTGSWHSSVIKRCPSRPGLGTEMVKSSRSSEIPRFTRGWLIIFIVFTWSIWYGLMLTWQCIWSWWYRYSVTCHQHYINSFPLNDDIWRPHVYP